MKRLICVWLAATCTSLTILSGAAAAAVPPAPTSLNATAGDARVTLDWPAVPGALGYHVYRSTAGVWDATPVARVNGTNYINGPLSNGTTYSYRVAAYNDSGAGPSSPIVTATPLSAPKALTAQAGDARVTLTWNASVGATAYVIYRGISSSLSVLTSVGASSLVFVDTGLTNDTTYYYFVVAQAGTSTSPPSQAVSAKPLPSLPSTVPTNLTATAGNAQVALDWSPIAGATGYRIFRTTTGVWAATPFASVAGPTYKDMGLANGTTYSYKVASYNSGGTGPFSAIVTAIPLAPPPAPTGITATAGENLATLTWTPVAGATSYSVYRGTASHGEATTPVAAGLASPPFVDRGVLNGSTYYYQLTAVNAGGQSAGSQEVSVRPEGAAAPALNAETLAAFRFLRQVTWGPRPGDVDVVKSVGRDAYLAALFSVPASNYPDAIFEMGIGAAQAYFMSLALTGPDQLRQRVAWALHKIWVVSAVDVPSAPAIVTYHRLLLNGAFGNYRDLMRDMTLNPAMGRYLNMVNNRSQAVTGTPPNENYARELMQLFTVGIPTLSQNGTPVLNGGGNQIPVYTEQDVKELARILTGWVFNAEVGRENYASPMMPVQQYHDTGAKVLLGQNFPASQTARQDLDQALDLLFNHPNVGPFISRQLIQQLVTSNPSPAYVGAIAAVFNNNGGGVRGDLTAVVRAIVTHPEAIASTPASGKLAEPALFITSTLRALNASGIEYPFLSAKAESMGQNVLYPGSVFSYFSPGYRVRGTNAGGGVPLVGPEFQILTSVTALERANFVGALLGGSLGGSVVIDYSPFMSRAADAAALVDYCNLVFMGGRMSLEERTEIFNSVRNIASNNPSERVRSALYLTLTAAQAQVDY